MEKWYKASHDLLKQLIATPSFSGEEDATATIIQKWLQANGVNCRRKGNNVYAHKIVDADKKTLLLNSHHDTVRPASGYTKDPFAPVVEDGKLYGLGSNDAGASLVALAVTFLYFAEQGHARYNLMFAATAEEEISGIGGINMLMQEMSQVDCAIVGEPTQMQMAVAERGLLVLDILSKGKAGHAARNEGVNALYKAMDDISKLKAIRFEKVSELLGATTLNVTGINTENKAHNMVPDTCSFIVDVRVNECYTLEEVLGIIKTTINADVKERSLRLRSTMIPLEHDLVQTGLSLGMKPYGSPTLSDKALLPFPALKLGPGDSARSHTADEFIYLHEIDDAIKKYIDLIKTKE